MRKIVIKQASIVNEGEIKTADILIKDERIEKIASSISDSNAFEIVAEGQYLLPGVIDDQVHFREPGLIHKATIQSESKAAVAGGITSFMDMPNTIPNTLSRELLEEKYQLASKTSTANYSFFMGINQENLDEALRIDNEWVCGITDDGLYFNSDKGILANYPDYLEKVFSRSDSLIALHCEDDEIIQKNQALFNQKYGDDISIVAHPLIRSEDACFSATKRVVDLARKHQNRLHIFHVSTAAETTLFDADIAVGKKKITAEACVHHLWFAEDDYEKLGSWIKWNPAIKKVSDRNAIVKAINENTIDVIATDHAPHTFEEKSQMYFKAPSGGPLVQYALLAMLDKVKEGKFTIEKIVEKMCHAPAELFQVQKRGFIREGYFADIVLVDSSKSITVSKESILSKCGWSPFEGHTFSNAIDRTFVNGNLVYQQGIIFDNLLGNRLTFDR
ncbi:MAG: dihydroorotase [Bacteroidota bacterium]